MPNLDKTGPEGKGPKTGRKLGSDKKPNDQSLLEKLGTGLGLRRKSGGGIGRGKRLRTNVKK
jgi:hypothetical protein